MSVPKKIEELWMWMAVETDGSEGIVATIIPGLGVTPFVGADKERIHSFRDEAVRAARARGITIKLVRFYGLEVVETIPGRSS